MKDKKILILLGIIIVVIAIVAISVTIIMPKMQLNKAVEYLKDGNYKGAYDYINSKNNEDNKIIIEELTTSIFCDRASSGCEKVADIANECTSVVGKIDINNIDYTLDDYINIYVENLDDYINLENEISKDMISEELAETYDLYFSTLKYVRENYCDVLNHINDEAFINETNNLASNFTQIANDCNSYGDNHKFKSKTQDIYSEIKQYIVK